MMIGAMLPGAISSAQSFTGKTGMIFIDDVAAGSYSGRLIVESGILKKTDIIDVHSPSGRKFTFTIVSLQVEDQDAAEAKPGQYVFAVLHSDADATGADGINEGFLMVPAGWDAGDPDLPTPPTGLAEFTCKLNGIPWSGTGGYNFYLYYPDGVEGIFDGPLLNLAFKAVPIPDNRQFLIYIRDVKEGPAVYNSSENLSVNFSGSEDGKPENSLIFGFDETNSPQTPFTIEITKWTIISPAEVSISGKMIGTLPQSLVFYGDEKKTIQITDGVFSNLKFQVLPSR